MAKIHDINNWGLYAIKLVWGDRQSDYDNPINDFIGTALNLTSFLRRKLAPGKVIGVMDIPMIIIGFKISRESYRHKADNIIDIIGYSLTLQRIKEWLESHNLKHTDLIEIAEKLKKEKK